MKNPNHQEDNHKRVVRQIRNTNQNGSKVNPEKFQDVQDNEKSDRSYALVFLDTIGFQLVLLDGALLRFCLAALYK
jgi:hypothetical protein